MRRDPAVEMARVLGCLIVIGVHVCLPAVAGGGYDPGRVFISCLVADGVAIFWIITGFFYFNNTYKKIGRKTFKKIGIPMIVFSVFSFYLSGWILNDVPLAQSIFGHTKEEYVNVFRTLLTWNNPVPAGSHLWYLYTYVLVILIFPVLKSFIDYLEAEPRNRIKPYLCLSFTLLVINDIVSNRFGNFNLGSVGALIPAAIEVTYGHFLYKYKSYFCKKKYIITAPVVFLGLNCIRAIIQIKRYYLNPSDNSILFWFSSIGIICAMSVIIFCFALENYIKNYKIKKVFVWGASYTMGIYIIHTYVNALLGKYGVTEHIHKFFLARTSNIVFEILYTITLTLAVFLASFLGAVILRLLDKGIKKTYQILPLAKEKYY